MCEPARKLIRLTTLTEFTMSEGEAYNGDCCEFARPSSEGMKSTPSMPLVQFAWYKKKKKKCFGWTSLYCGDFFLNTVCFCFSFCGASDWSAKAAVCLEGSCPGTGPTIRGNRLPGLPSCSKQSSFLMLF